MKKDDRGETEAGTEEWVSQEKATDEKQDENKEERNGRTGLVLTGRGDWRRRPIPRVNKKYKGNRKRTRTEDERGNRRETRDIEYSGETNGIGYVRRKTTRRTTRKRQRDEKPKNTRRGYDEERIARITANKMKEEGTRKVDEPDRRTDTK
jgi:hypothetical protein